MAEKRLKRPRDPVQLAKLIGDIATGQVEDMVIDERAPAAVTRGKLGGKIGGKARAAAMTSAQRSAAARKAAKTRWAKRRSG
jgi:hypothetical protein